MAHTGSTSQVETKREEQVTASCAEENRTGEEQNEAATSLVETAAARMCETVEILCSCPKEILGEAAREDLAALTPHFEDALVALEDIERRRCLTEKELAQRRAFRTLLAQKW
jgi:hypothetical protein